MLRWAGENVIAKKTLFAAGLTALLGFMTTYLQVVEVANKNLKNMWPRHAIIVYIIGIRTQLFLYRKYSITFETVQNNEKSHYKCFRISFLVSVRKIRENYAYVCVSADVISNLLLNAGSLHTNIFSCCWKRKSIGEPFLMGMNVYCCWRRRAMSVLGRHE